MKGYTFFLILAQKHRLWVLVRTEYLHGQVFVMIIRILSLRAHVMSTFPALTVLTSWQTLTKQIIKRRDVDSKTFKVSKIHEIKRCSDTIRITCLCIEYPLKPHFYIVKLGYEGYIISFSYLCSKT